MNISDLLLLLLPLFFTIPIQSSPTPSSSPSHFIKSTRRNSINQTSKVEPQEYFEVTQPLLTDGITPACSVSVLNHSFGNTYGSPPVSVNYTPPPAKCEWSLAVLEFRAECKGEQYDRIAGIWIDGAELLRTSTAQPTDDGIFWNVRKDVTRYSPIITRSNATLSVMLENIVNDEFTGVYHVNVSFHFYSDTAVRFPVSVVPIESEAHTLIRKLISVQNHGIGNKLGLDHSYNAVRFPVPVVPVESEAHTMNKKLISFQHPQIRKKLGLGQDTKSIYPYDTPADLIIPVSGAVDEGFWFRIQNENDLHTKNVQLSPKTYKVVLELYVSFHGDDEFWYMNPPDSYIETNNLATGRSHGAYREILVTIDGILVGSVNPFPVIFTGGINPLFWSPVVSIGAFDLPSYDINLTPFLGLLLDNKNHSIGLQVADGISFWLIDANLHLWLDHSDVVAETKDYKVPTMEIEREYEFEQLNGEFEIESERSIKATGWVTYSAGRVKTRITEEISYKNRIKIENDGNRTNLNQRIKRKTKVKITYEKDDTVDKFTIERIYPVDIKIQTKPGKDEGTHTFETRAVQERSEKFSGGNYSRVLDHNMNCTGSMVVKGHSVLSGLTENHQNYAYKDETGCYSRQVDVVNGAVVGDAASSICVN